jgi:6-phosphogluconate dehydrogenase
MQTAMQGIVQPDPAAIDKPGHDLANIGLIGLGTMGASLALNIAEKGFRIAVWNLEPEGTEAFMQRAGDLGAHITPTRTLADLVAAIQPPRAIILLIPAGAPIDQQIAALAPLLAPGDMIVDAGNSDFHDTERRVAAGAPLIGIGVSGGAEGARIGPAIMAGGTAEQWAHLRPVLGAIAAHYQGEPCATWMGQGGAGHFVKMVHNGIEYADMQMIAEAYGILRDGLQLSADAIAGVFADWNQGALQSYLVEISARVAAAKDPQSGTAMLDLILDAAGQKGTGRWTAIEAQHLGAPVPAVEAAVTARNLSSRLAERSTGDAIFDAPAAMAPGTLSPEVLEAALIAGKIICYAQGFTMLASADQMFGAALPLPEIARNWREGCIIRSSMLNDMSAALAEAPGRNLIFAPFFADLIRRHMPALRQTVAAAAQAGIALPALSSGLAWFDTIRSKRGTANMIQAQRDYFGAHGFERLDRPGVKGLHGPWASERT